MGTLINLLITYDSLKYQTVTNIITNYCSLINHYVLKTEMFVNISFVENKDDGNNLLRR